MSEKNPPPRRIGLPRLHKEAGERRDFLPSLVEFMGRVGAEEIVIEKGYGSGMEVPEAEYLAASPRARIGTFQECVGQDLVITIRCPSEEALSAIRPGTTLVSMLHFPTRPRRVARLRELNVRGVSLDEVKDELGQRLVQNMQAVGWNGVRAAFDVLRKQYRRFEEPGRRPLRVTLMGSGAVGGYAAHAAVRYGNPALRQELADKGVRGVEVTLVDYELTSDENYMLTLLEQTDLLIDATQRPDPSRVIIRNEWVAALPQHAVVLDLSVDPYDFSVTPPEVKGIEGLPEGNLDKYVFQPDDPAWDAVDPRVGHVHRRTSLSCYSWPGLEPRKCMEVYSKQIEPVLRVILERGLDGIDPAKGPYYDRAVARADLARWRVGRP